MANEVIVPAVRVPAAGVRLTGGILKQAHEDNIGYLKSLSMDSILYWFRVKAALPAPGERAGQSPPSNDTGRALTCSVP